MIKVLYAGSPAPSAVTLEGLINSGAQAGFEIAGVLTNPPSAQGRHKTLIPTPVEEAARRHNIPVFTPEHLDSDCRAQVSAVGADILVCFAYGHIFGPKFLELFKYGGINLHPSALPEYRGCTPVNAAILNMDQQTAFTVQKVSLKMDEGNILVQKYVPLTKKETAGSLLNYAAECGIELISSILKELSQNSVLPEGTPQSGKPSYTSIIKKEDARLDWNKSAEQIDACVRGYSPDPCTWTVEKITEKGVEKETPLKIIEGFALSEEEACGLGADLNSKPGTASIFVKSKGILIRSGKGFFAVTKLQRQGKNPMDYKSFMNGVRDFIGSVLG